MLKEYQSTKETAKVKKVVGNKIDIEDPDKPGVTTTVDTDKVNIDTDDQGNIIIRDSYDANIGKGEAEQSGRFRRFATNLVPGQNYPMSIASGIAGLLGSAEGRGAPIEINLGTIEILKDL